MPSLESAGSPAGYRVAPARSGDIPMLAGIELAAAAMLEGHAPPAALLETTPEGVLRRASVEGRLWVALKDDAPVAFAHVELIEPGAAHLEEIDVHPAHGRRGLGTLLVRRVCSWAFGAGYRSVTLTTFRDVPWNLPFYARMGFGVVPPGEVSPTLRGIVRDEALRGLDPARRVVMRCSPAR